MNPGDVVRHKNGVFPDGDALKVVAAESSNDDCILNAAHENGPTNRMIIMPCRHLEVVQPALVPGQKVFITASAPRSPWASKDGVEKIGVVSRFGGICTYQVPAGEAIAFYRLENDTSTWRRTELRPMISPGSLALAIRSRMPGDRIRIQVDGAFVDVLSQMPLARHVVVEVHKDGIAGISLMTDQTTGFEGSDIVASEEWQVVLAVEMLLRPIDPRDVKSVWVRRPDLSDPMDCVSADMIPSTSGPPSWSIRSPMKPGSCFTRRGEWEFEPQPSERDRAFLSRVRFGSVYEAIDAYEASREDGIACASCNSRRVRTTMEDHKMFDTGKQAKIRIPVRGCLDCGLKYTDEEAEKIIEEACERRSHDAKNNPGEEDAGGPL